MSVTTQPTNERAQARRSLTLASAPPADESPGVADRTVVDHDPATLLVDVNVRHDVRLDKQFLASVKEHGVLVPVVAVRTAEGAIRVRPGHRRTLAALEAGRTVPVVVIGDEATDEAGQIERLVAQYVENEHRTDLANGEVVAVTEQLALLGLSPAQIAKRTQMPRKRVTAALAVAGSELAKAAASRYDYLTIDQAAIVADFEDDTETVTALLAAAKTGKFDHVAQHARDARADRQAHDQAAARLTEDGIRVISEEDFHSNRRCMTLASLTDDAEADDGEAGRPLTAAEHAGCPGHAAYLSELWVAEADPEQDEDGEPAGSWEWKPIFVCTDAAERGHRPRYGLGFHTDTGSATGSGEGRMKVADMTPERREQARAERREVIENNKAWASAQTVRRTWLQAFAARPRAPKGSATFLANAIAHDVQILSDIGGIVLVGEMLGIKTAPYGRSTELHQLIDRAPEARAHMIELVLVLAAYEARTGREQWRAPVGHTIRYLTFLHALGYSLSDVECLAQHPQAEADSD